MSKAKIVPSHVMTVLGGMQPVIRVLAHPPGQHPKHSPIRPDLTAVELVTRVGSRWFGFETARINSRLEMEVSGYSPLFESVNAWKDARED